MAASWANEASSSSSTVQRKYDVFLSFSGIDTRLKFTSHLLAALERHGFYTFRDNTKLNRGEDIGSELLKAIEESSISIIVFSKNYAMSKWCLDELVWIMKCKKTFNQIVLPIFYDVDPSDVRAQKGSLAEAFAKHEEHFGKSSDGKVEKWRAALTEAANKSGWDLKNEYGGDEVKLIAKIIEEVGNVIDLEHLSAADHPVGLEDRVQDLRMLLRMEPNDNDVRIVVVWGIGGLGKTTIAKVCINSSTIDLLVAAFLQISEKLGRNQMVWKEVIIQRALRRKVLIVLDDVDEIKQLKELAIDRTYFGLGSRIIITTRDLSSLNFKPGENEIYTPKELDEDKSLQLFSWHAFKEDHPIENYLELSKQVVDYASGLPLALEILGSFLSCNRSIQEWESAIEKLKKIPNEDIQEKLEISYNSLRKEEKELFLAIACFFVGMDRNFIIKILKGCDLFPKFGLRILFNRCLIKYGPWNELVMHDMLRDMGREIVKKESSDEPGRRSRLWLRMDGLEVLRCGTGTKVVKGLFLNFPESKEIQVNAKAFENMNELWLLHLNYVHLSSGDVNNLKFLYLSHCYYLTKTPNFSGLNNLEELLIDNCIRLVEIDESIGCLNKLIVLDMANCIKLEQFPSRILMSKSLEYLDLSGCSKLREFAGFKGLLSKSLYTFFSSWALPRKNVDSIGFSLQGLRSLKTLKIANFNMSYLPSEIGSLVSLTHLDLSGNKLDLANCNVSYLSSEIGNLISLTHLGLKGNDLCTLLDSIGNLTRLRSLNMEKCNVSYLPSQIGSLISLRHLDLTGNNLCTLPDSIGNLTCLQYLEMTNCNLDSARYEQLQFVTSARCNLEVELIRKLIRNNLRTIPNDICKLTNLGTLYLSGCARLQSIPELPKSIRALTAVDCVSLENIELKWLVGVHYGPILRFKGCHKLAESNFVNNVMKAAIQQVKDFHALESPAIHGFVSHSEIHLTWGEVPRRFEYQSEGSYLSVKVPPLINHKIRGLAVCIIYIGSNFNEKCKQTGSFCLEYHINKVRRSNSFCYPGDGLCSEDQMCLEFTLMSKLEGGDEVEIFITKCEQTQIKKCAAKLIFEVDENNADTNDEALADYISSPSPSAIQEEEEEVDYPSKRRRRSHLMRERLDIRRAKHRREMVELPIGSQNV
ncbi:unnamed protein product [Camellia sinensis]